MSELENILNGIYEHGIIDQSYVYTPFKGGTNSVIGALTHEGTPVYVLKMNSPENIASEAMFLKLYPNIRLFPKLYYVDPESRYILYHFVPGNSKYSRGNKKALLEQLVTDVLNDYVPATGSTKLNWIDEPKGELEYINWSKGVIGHHLTEEDYQFVCEIFEGRRKRIIREDLYVLHGDFGVHNFLFNGEKLTGVIDPIPIVGQPFHDLLYAYCSSPDDLFPETIIPASQKLKSRKPDHFATLREEVVLALYFRMASCIKHHPEDIAAYVQAWECWKRGDFE